MFTRWPILYRLMSGLRRLLDVVKKTEVLGGFLKRSRHCNFIVVSNISVVSLSIIGIHRLIIEDNH